VISLAVLAGLIAVLAGAAASQRIAIRAQMNRMDQQVAEFAAEAGLQHVLAILALQDRNLTGLTDEWYDFGLAGDENFVMGEEASFRVQIMDASGRIDINFASEDLLRRLPMTTEQIDSLLDWRSPEFVARPEGAKDDYYNRLTVPYNAKLGSFDTLDELLLVRGFTPGTLYEPQTDIVSTAVMVQGEEQLPLVELLTVNSVSADVTAAGAPKLNVNSQQVSLPILITQAQLSPIVAQAIIARRNLGPITSMGELLRLPGVTTQAAASILNNLSVSGAAAQQGRINVNTASESVLNSLPAITPDVAASIVSRQSIPFNSLGELTEVPGMSVEILAEIADLLSVNSRTFLVRVEGRGRRARVAFEAMVRLEEDTLVVDRFVRAPFADMPTRWGWQEQTTADNVLIQ
jgi:type II secretory pathway component PulK